MNVEQAEKLKADFDRDGVVVLRNFVPQAQVQEICRRAEDATQSKIRTDRWSNITKGMEKLDDYFGEFLHKGAHVPILEMLLGKKPEPTTASFFTKVDNAGEVHPHADAMDGAVVWVALDETTNDNGCMNFIKGSHHRREEFSYLQAHEPNDLSEHPDRLEASMSPGDIILFRSTTVHWSGPNREGTDRRGFNSFYVGDPRKWQKGMGKAKAMGKAKSESKSAAKAK